MDNLLQVLSASVAFYNLPLTILLICVLGYWLMVATGLLDLHSADGAGGDFHGDVAGGHIDGHVDGHVDGHAGAGGHHAGMLQALMSLMGTGHVPVMVVVSFLVLSLWAIALLANYYLNPHGSGLIALGLFIPNLVASLLATRLLVMPLRPFFAAMNKDYDQAVPIVGQICQITTSEVTGAFGQAMIETRGAPITINVRLSTGEPLRRGDQALVIEEDREKQIYRVIKYEQPKLEM